MRTLKWALAIVLAGATTPGWAQSDEKVRNDFADFMAKRAAERQSPEQLEQRVALAEQSALGSEANPVRVEMAWGERAYLDRLRCADGKAARYARGASKPGKAYPNIVDVYELTCRSGSPTLIYMDMYHRGHVENRAIAGFTIR